MLSRLFAGGDSILMEQTNHATFSGAKDALEAGLKRDYEGRLFVRNRIWAVRGLVADGRRRSPFRRAIVLLTAPDDYGRERHPGRGRRPAPAGRGSGPLSPLPRRAGGMAMSGKILAGVPRRDRARRRRRHHRQRGREHRRLRRAGASFRLPCRCSPCRSCSPPSAGWPRRPARAAPCSTGSPASATISRSPRRSGSRRSIRPKRRPNCSSATCPMRSRSRSRMTGPRASPSVLAAAAASGQAQSMGWYSGHSDPWNDPGDFADSVGSSLASTISSASTAPARAADQGAAARPAAAAAAAEAAAGEAARAARIRSASSRSAGLSTSIAASAKGSRHRLQPETRLAAGALGGGLERDRAGDGAKECPQPEEAEQLQGALAVLFGPGPELGPAHRCRSHQGEQVGAAEMAVGGLEPGPPGVGMGAARRSCARPWRRPRRRPPLRR